MRPPPRPLDLSAAMQSDPPEPFVRVDFERELSKVEALTEDQVAAELRYHERRQFRRDMEQQQE